MDVYAWVLMPNHYHILCKTQNRGLASSMRKILTGYVVNFNRRHRRRRVVVEARGAIAWIAVRELGYSGADVARFLGETNSCVTRFIASDKRPDVDDLIRKL